MKNFKNIFLLILMIAFTFTSCRQEDEEIIDPPVEQAISANSAISNLLRNVASSDGSFDNIIDGASCFSIQLPVTVIVNGTEITVESTSDYQTIEDIFDASDTDVDSLEIVFPVTVIFDDYTTATVNSYGEFLALIAQCPDENTMDDDIECIDIQYPITAAIFNSNNEQIETIIITNDEELFEFIENLPNYEVATIEFPITVILADGTSVQVFSLQELADIIENAEDDCDEDDDNDYDDDDCNNCTTDDLSEILTSCPSWSIDKLERNDNDLEDQYTNYDFVFNTDGSLDVNNDGTIINGSWSATGEGNAIVVNINVPGLADVNDNWILHEIENDDEIEVDLRVGDDRLSFECGDGSTGSNDDCDACTTAALTEVLVDCSAFQIDQLERDDMDLEDQYAGYDFVFESNGLLTVTQASNEFNGTWSASGTGNAIIVSINVSGLPDVNENWLLHSIETTTGETQVDLRLGDDRLRFESDCDNNTGGGDDDLTIALTAANSFWVVSSYTEDGDNQTSDYNGFQFEFSIDGTISVSGVETSTGTWSSINDGTEMGLNFGPEAPLEELNDEDWEVLSVTDTEVQLRDVSGGGGGTDLLTLTRL
jgi:hypothetical protein